MAGTAQCNICGSRRFEVYRGRPNEKCAECGGKARHRAALDLYRRHLGDLSFGEVRVLHLAPEACLHDPLRSMFGGGYVTADAAPERYPHAAPLRLFLPDDLEIFPQHYFDAILHIMCWNICPAISATIWMRLSGCS